MKKRLIYISILLSLVLTPVSLLNTQSNSQPVESVKAETFAWADGIGLMPSKNITLRFEVVHREADVPYFAGPGGVTSPDGYIAASIPADWSPDLVKAETRFIGALLVRI